MQFNLEHLKAFLIDSNIVTKKEMAEAEETVKKTGQDLSEVLISSGVVTEDEYRRTEAYVLGIPFVDLKGQKIDFEVLSSIPEPIARSHNIVAFKKTDSDLEVAMLDPQDFESVDFVKKKTSLKILPRLTDKDSIKHALLQYQKSLKAEFGDIIQKEAISIKAVSDVNAENVAEEDLEKLAADLPVVKIVDTLINHAILQQASDIHIEPMEKEVMIRYRIDGVLHDAMVLPKEATAGIIARIKVLSNLRLDEKRLPQDGRFKIEMGDQKVSFRVSTLPTYYGEKVVMRLLPDSVRGFTLESLGFHGQGLEKIHRALQKTTGLILATGPTGSGKTTTLYTMLDILNKPDVNISTVEDPIEYQMPRINQTQVRPEIGFTFATGLRALVRQDPDILMVGEIRDRETIDLAVNASLTGHLVLSTIHTNSASAAFTRMVDMGAQAFLLVSTIEVIIAQRLVRRLCKTKDSYKPTKTELSQLAEQADMDKVLTALIEDGILKKGSDWGDVLFYRPKPSDDCPEGYSSRIGIHEILSISPAIRDLVMKGSTASDIEAQARKEGMLTMIEDGIYKAAQGLTSIEEVLRVASN